MQQDSKPADSSSPAGAEAIRTALEAAKATPAQIESVLWLFEHAQSKGLTTYPEIGKLIGYSGTTISRVFRGRYPTGINEVVDEIDAFKTLTSERRGFGEAVFCETSVVKDVKAICDLARSSQTIALLWGPNQSGKTTALRHYQAKNNHGRTIFVRMPVGGSAAGLLIALARACGISARGNTHDLRRSIHRFFTPSTLLIVDEMHQALIGRQVRAITVETLRELHDERECGVVLCGTDVLPDMFSDPRFRSFLGQIDNRGILRRRIPAQPSAADVRLILKAYKLPVATGEARKVVQEIASKHGIGRLSKVLLMSRRMAANEEVKEGRPVPLEWRHVLSTIATLKFWAEGGEQAEEGGVE